MRVKTYGKTKPRIRPTVDWSNPIANRMWCCYTFGEKGGTTVYDACRRGAGDMIFSGTNPIWTSRGLSVGNGTGFVRNNKTLITAQNPVIGDMTVRVRHIPRSWPGGFTALLDAAGTAGSGRILNIFVDTSGNIVYRGVGGSDGSAGANTALMATGEVSDLVWVRRIGTEGVYSRFQWYKNGRFLFAENGFASLSNLWPTTGHDFSCGGNPSGGGTAYDGQYLKVQVWSRALSPLEIQWLYANPYGDLVSGAGIRGSAGQLLAAASTGGVMAYPQSALTTIRNGRASFLSSRRTTATVRAGFQIKTQAELATEYDPRFDDPQYYKAGR